MPAKQSIENQVLELRQASRQLLREWGYLEVKNKHVDATAPQIHTLIEINHNQMLTVAELARILYLNQSSTCRTIAGLRRLGWVETVKLKNNQKDKPVKLTTLGKQKLDEINHTCGDVYKNALALLSDVDRELVVKAFNLYAQAHIKARVEHQAKTIGRC